MQVLNKIIKVEPTKVVLTKDEMKIAKSIDIALYKCYRNAVFVAKALNSDALDAEFGVVEGYALPKVPKCCHSKYDYNWHYVNYIKWGDEIQYFDLTAEKYADQRYDKFYAIRTQTMGDIQRQIDLVGDFFPTIVVNLTNDNKYIYMNNNGEIVAVDKPNNFLDNEPYLDDIVKYCDKENYSFVQWLYKRMPYRTICKGTIHSVA